MAILPFATKIIEEHPCILILSLIWIVLHFIIHCFLTYQEKKILGRRMSTMTYLLSQGAFPDSVGQANHAINCCLFTKSIPSKEEVQYGVEKNLLPYRRFKSIPTGQYWKEVSVDMKNHIEHVQVDNYTDVLSKLKTIANRPLSHNIPLWEVVIIENKEISPLSSENDNSSYFGPKTRVPAPFHCIVIRIGHVIGGGTALVEVLIRLATDYSGNVIDQSALLGLKRATLPKKKNILLTKFHLLFRLLRYLKMLFKVLRGIPTGIQMATGSYDSSSNVTASYEMRRTGLKYCTNPEIALGGPWSLDYVKRIKSSLGVSVNDVFMGAFAGALRAAIHESKDFEEKRIRTLMAYAFLRQPEVYDDPDRALANNWTLVSTDLAVNCATRVNRIHQTQKYIKKIKRTLQPLSNVFLNYLGSKCLSLNSIKQILLNTYNRHSFVFANVPGSSFKIRVCGHSVEEMQIIFVGLLPQIEIFTYAGRIFFSLVADPKIIPNPQHILDLFAEELKGLGSDLGISPEELDVPIGLGVPEVHVHSSSASSSDWDKETTSNTSE